MGGEKCSDCRFFAHKAGSPPRGRGKAGFAIRCSLQVGITPAWAGKSLSITKNEQHLKDHPRVGGEKLRCTQKPRDTPGSPPRGRGKVRILIYSVALDRITPAWAGKSDGFALCPWSAGDHPRVGGEKSAPCTLAASGRGSPPRGRGKVSYAPEVCNAVGITPAWAGKRKPVQGYCKTRGDHPRVGGEKNVLKWSCRETKGSPPRGRGKARLHTQLDDQGRITPAWAGKSRQSPASEMPTKDHPRVGGEKFASSRNARFALGSPPRGRGKGLFIGIRYGGSGITPAWAGKSLCVWRERYAHGDHPRVGGEKVLPIFWSVVPMGSPPRGRGKVRFVPLLAVLVGITPAWAGKSVLVKTFLSVFGDHPRVGGEKKKWLLCRTSTQGSPPRGRGKAAVASSPQLWSGITPAWAGKSGTSNYYGILCEDHPRVGGEKVTDKLDRERAVGSPPRGRGKERALRLSK